jgi:hypothetical protein
MRSGESEPRQATKLNSLSEILHATYDDRTASVDLIKLGNNSEHDEYQAVRVAAYIGSTMKQLGDPASGLQGQSAFFPYLHRGLSQLMPGIYRIALDYIATYWSTQVERCPFRFSAPTILRNDLARALAEPEKLRAQSILRAVAASLGVTFPPEIKEWLSQQV